MNPFLKFIYFIMPATTVLLFLLLAMIQSSDHTLNGCEFIVFLFFCAFIGNLVMYRGHVKRNIWLSELNEYRNLKAVTMYGPLGQFAYYFTEIQPYGPSRPKPEKRPENKGGLTDADRLI